MSSRGFKRKIRKRMAETGESYMQAMRALELMSMTSNAEVEKRFKLVTVERRRQGADGKR